MVIQELNMQEIEQVSGGDFSPTLATYGTGVAMSAGYGGVTLGPAGFVAGAVGYSIGFGLGYLFTHRPFNRT